MERRNPRKAGERRGYGGESEERAVIFWEKKFEKNGNGELGELKIIPFGG